MFYHIESMVVKITKFREYAGVLVKEYMYNPNDSRFWAVLYYEMS